jgi:hypothetical protein
MASKPRAKASAGVGKGKAARRPVRPKAGAGMPLMPVVAGVILGVLTIALIITIVYLQRPQAGPPTVSGIPCDHLEHSTSHYHAALQIVYQDHVVNLPDYAGIQYDSAGTTPSCYWWLHVHAGEKNVIHIESPASQTFTLGQFIDVWNEWSQRNGHGAEKLDSTHVATFPIGPSDKVVTYIDLQDGKGPTLYSGDPRAIVLKQHEVITIAINPGADFKAPAFTFPSGT